MEGENGLGEKLGMKKIESSGPDMAKAMAAVVLLFSSLALAVLLCLMMISYPLRRAIYL